MGMRYPFEFEIAGPLAIFNQPEASPFYLSYPAPTISCVEAWIKNTAYLDGALPVIQTVKICRPTKYYRYNFENTGTGRYKPNVTNGDADIHLAICLEDVRFQVAGYFENSRIFRKDRITTNPAHCYQRMFKRNLRRGRCRQSPHLGWKEFQASYFGPVLPDTKPENINTFLVDMIARPFGAFSSKSPGANNPPRRIKLLQITNGTINYEPFYTDPGFSYSIPEKP